MGTGSCVRRITAAGAGALWAVVCAASAGHSAPAEGV
jgi:hypothetical protein